MQKIVINASPLIFLAKLEKLSFLDDYEIFVPHAVREELFVDVRPEQDLIRNFFDQKKIHLVEPQQQKFFPAFLGTGEKAVITLALEKKIALVFLDDHRARMIARSLKLETRGTLGILLEQVTKKKITPDEAKALLQKLTKAGFRISEELLLKVWKELSV